MAAAEVYTDRLKMREKAPPTKNLCEVHQAKVCLKLPIRRSLPTVSMSQIHLEIDKFHRVENSIAAKE